MAPIGVEDFEVADLVGVVVAEKVNEGKVDGGANVVVVDVGSVAVTLTLK